VLGFLHQKGFETFNHQEELSPATVWQPLQEESPSYKSARWLASSHSGFN